MKDEHKFGREKGARIRLLRKLLSHVGGDHSPWGVCTHFIYLILQLQISPKKPPIIGGSDSLLQPSTPPGWSKGLNDLSGQQGPDNGLWTFQGLKQ